MALCWQNGIDEDLSSNCFLWIPTFSLCLTKFSPISNRTFSIFGSSYLCYSWLLFSLAFTARKLHRGICKINLGEISSLDEIHSKNHPSITCFYHISFLVHFLLILCIFQVLFAYSFYFEMTTYWVYDVY